MTAAPDRPDTAAEVDEVEAVARALQAEYETIFGQGRGWNLAERFARAALAARCRATEAEQAVARCRRLAVDFERLPGDMSVFAADAARWIRAALDGAARDGSDG